MGQRSCVAKLAVRPGSTLTDSATFTHLPLSSTFAKRSLRSRLRWTFFAWRARELAVVKTQPTLKAREGWLAIRSSLTNAGERRMVGASGFEPLTPAV